MRILFLLIPLLLFASSVNVTVNKKILTAGEELVITINAQGKDIKFPNIQEIDGNKIVGTSSSDNISIINGKMSETITKSFILFPQKSLTIPSFNVIINGKIYHTKPIHITVIEPKQTKGNFELDINVSNKNLYLGEDAILTLKFIKKAPAQSVQIQRPYIKNFLIKEINSKTITKANKEILIYKFLIIPQKVGSYQIGPYIAQVGKLVQTQTDNFFGLQITNIQYKNIYSNKLKIKVKPIPKNSIYGNFHIYIKAKKVLKADEPNKIKLIISGCGDFYSIEPFNLNIKNATVYQNKPKLFLKIKNNKLCGKFVQTFVVLANNSYVIPSFKLKTFNGKIHTISTPKINVKIINSLSNIKKTNHHIHYVKTPISHMEKNKINLGFIILISLASLIIGIMIGILILKAYNYLKDDEIIKIKKADEKELLNILKKYENNKEIKKIMEQIEENIYKNANNKINKKDIIKIIKQIRRGK